MWDKFGAALTSQAGACKTPALPPSTPIARDKMWDKLEETDDPSQREKIVGDMKRGAWRHHGP